MKNFLRGRAVRMKSMRSTIDHFNRVEAAGTPVGEDCPVPFRLSGEFAEGSVNPTNHKPTQP